MAAACDGNMPIAANLCRLVDMDSARRWPSIGDLPVNDSKALCNKDPYRKPRCSTRAHLARQSQPANAQTNQLTGETASLTLSSTPRVGLDFRAILRRLLSGGLLGLSPSLAFASGAALGQGKLRLEAKWEGSVSVPPEAKIFYPFH